MQTLKLGSYVFPEGLDADEAGALVKADRFGLTHTRLEDQARRTELARFGLEGFRVDDVAPVYRRIMHSCMIKCVHA